MPWRTAAARRLESFSHALSGVWFLLKTEPNARIHAVATVIAIAMGVLLRVTWLEWVAVILVIVAVWTAEAMNTALELLADVVSPEIHPLIGRAKDVAAGAVLVSALGAAVVGLLIFGPRLLEAL